MRTLLLFITSCFLTAATAAGENAEYVRLLRQARTEYLSGHFPASEKLFVAALGALQKSEERERADVLVELASLYTAEDDLPKAEKTFLESLTIYTRLSDATGRTVALRTLGAVYCLEGRFDDASRALKQALKLAKDSEPRLVAQVLNSLGVLNYQQGKHHDAESFFNQALELVSPTGSLWNSGEVLSNLASVYQAKGQFEKSEDFYMRAVKVTEAAIGPSHPDLTFTLSALGTLYSDTGRYAEAETQFRRALAILEPDKSTFEIRIAKILHRLAVIYIKAGRKDQAAVALEQAAGIARRHINENRDMVVIVEDYSATLKSAGKRSEAEELRAEARRARLKESLVVNAHSPF
jgi:tetratricopeptide (TPR) repeat protein